VINRSEGGAFAPEAGTDAMTELPAATNTKVQ
jgi:hypothetical protein